MTAKRTIGNLTIGGDRGQLLHPVGIHQELSAAANPRPPRSAARRSRRGERSAASAPDIANRISNTPEVSRRRLPGARQEADPRPNRRQRDQLDRLGLGRSDPSGINNPGQYQRSQAGLPVRGTPEHRPASRLINVKVEGAIDNSGLQRGQPVGLVPTSPRTSAFFAKSVKLEHAPVIPPNVPEQPFPTGPIYHNGQRYLKGLFKVDHSVTLPKKSSTKR